MTRIQLRPNGPESYIVLRDGQGVGAFWRHEVQDSTHCFVPVFKVGLEQPWDFDGEIELLSRVGHAVIWQDGQLITKAIEYP